MDEIDFLPDELKSRSLSSKEIVLKFEDALLAIDTLIKANLAILGWEGWLKYADGRIGHSLIFQGTISIDRDKDEPWELYVLRSAEFCRNTIKQDQQIWDKKPEFPDATLYYCITAVTERSISKTNKKNQKAV